MSIPNFRKIGQTNAKIEPSFPSPEFCKHPICFHIFLKFRRLNCVVWIGHTRIETRKVFISGWRWGEVKVASERVRGYLRSEECGVQQAGCGVSAAKCGQWIGRLREPLKICGCKIVTHLTLGRPRLPEMVVVRSRNTGVRSVRRPLRGPSLTHSYFTALLLVPVPALNRGTRGYRRLQKVHRVVLGCTSLVQWSVNVLRNYATSFSPDLRAILFFRRSANWLVDDGLMLW